VICPDQTSQCEDGQTCCKLSSGEWGCCPLPNAVCCTDHEHCCPTGYTCDVPEQKCNKQNGKSISWSRKVEATPVEWVNGDHAIKVGQRCHDGSSCSDQYTCCLVSAASYGCCPLPQATCCNDYTHCCPHGYQCDLPRESCIQEDGGLEIPWTLKVPSRPAAPRAEQGLCPDEESRCQDGSTCCGGSHSNGRRKCCPYENAVCCSDGLHCCPADTTCNTASMMCESNGINMAISWRLLEKTVGVGFLFAAKNDVTCPDQTSKCPAGSTCCQTQAGFYGCCPFKEAICCEDKLHCCPSGSKCDVEHSTCIFDDSGAALPWDIFGHRRAKTVV
jgi:progranulin